MPVSQIGAPVTMIDAATLDALGKPDVLEALRLVPGAQVNQTGGRGGPTSLFVRGGASNFNKVLIDGVAANDIGGGFDFSSLSVTGVDRVEVLRESNSVLYGSDSLSGVVSISTRRGRTRIPEFSYSIDGGNLSTMRNDISVGGASGRFDYFSATATSGLTTTSRTTSTRTAPTPAGSAPHSATAPISAARSAAADTKSRQPEQHRLLRHSRRLAAERRLHLRQCDGAVADQRTLAEHDPVRVDGAEHHFLNPAPTGTPFDPFGFGANYLGNTVTITGANGYGHRSGDSRFRRHYPSVFDSATRRATLFSGQTSYGLASALTVVGRRRGSKRSRASRSREPIPSRKRAQQRRRLRRGARRRPDAWFRHRRRRRRSTTRSSGNAVVAARVGGGLSARTRRRRLVGRYQADVQRRQGYQGAGDFQELSSLSALLTPAQASFARRRPGRPGTREESRRRHRAGRAARPVASACHLFPQHVRRPARVPQQDRPASRSACRPRPPTPRRSGPTSTRSPRRATGVGVLGRCPARQGVRVAASYTYLDAEVTKP